MLTWTERALRHAFRAGTPLDAGGAPVRAAVIAELLLAGPPARPGRTARVDLAGARITGRLDLTGARFDAPLRLRRCTFDEPLVLDHAEIGSVNLDECELPSIDAESLRVRRWFGLRHARVAAGAWLHHIVVGGGLDLSGTTFGAEVDVQRAVVDGDAKLGHGTVYPAGVRIDGARIAGDLNIANATARAAAPDATAIRASGAVVGGGIWLHGTVAEGLVMLIGVRAEGAITLQGTVLRAAEGSALLLIEARTAMLTLRPAPDSVGAIVLRDAHVGRLVDDPATWPPACTVELAGLTYDRISRRSDDTTAWTARERLAWMARFDAAFTPGPYDQLAAALRRDGREGEARQVLRVRERRRHRAMGRLGASWGAVQDATIGFGYRPARALLWLIAVLAGGSTWFALHGPLAPVKPGESPTWDPLLYTLDLLVPLVDLGHEHAWNPVGADKAVAVLVMAAGWVLATTVVTGAGRALGR
ncbi:hypothetical protein [Dactylosporangium matsuzakiense]|uniref:Membrane-associated oxidoreductase n=1 Tax=Dactylosporangium matsuzakiense TaxID=53360 RepID=A0A9W6KQ49_9ACTN|nr:hypothetical protein [Dactylosporangium matsuzakiense]UWZ47736.1 pentapeptide repeat-containing protein [Dactylosporangium matsuzakiense]GLL06121.1 hypothetical protein GCM10017581_078690 [Dactylosporangium matsuzakiense]